MKHIIQTQYERATINTCYILKLQIIVICMHEMHIYIYPILNHIYIMYLMEDYNTAYIFA